MTARVGALLRVLGFSAALLPAQNLYLIPGSFVTAQDQHLTVSIQKGDAFPASVAAPDPGRLRDTDQINPAAFFTLDNLRVDQKAVVGDALVKSKGILVFTARTLPAVDKVEAGPLHDYLTREGLTNALSQIGEGQGARVRHSGYAKALIESESPDEFFNHVVGFLIEIVPEKNPYVLHAGDDLPIQVLFAGKPAADLKVTAERAGVGADAIKVSGRTAADGKITIPIRATGTWRIHSVEIHKCTEANVADWEILTASLTFEIR